MRKLALALALVCVHCSPTAEQRRALTVAQCIAGVASAVPSEDLLPKDATEYTVDDVIVAVTVMGEIRACARNPEPDAGS